MPTYRHLPASARAVLASTALVLGLGCSTTASAIAQEVVAPYPSVEVAVATVTSQEALTARLQQAGYSEIMLSALSPNPANPFPERNRASGENPRLTPVHAGWNGTAVKEGRLVHIHVSLRAAS